MGKINKSGKLNCGECKGFFEEDKLIADQKKNRYLCDSCYEPRNDRDPDIEQDPPEIEREKCPKCGEEGCDDECEREIDDGCEVEYDKEESPRALRGEVRIARERPPKENSKLISW